jgi:hypothetical protein
MRTLSAISTWCSITDKVPDAHVIADAIGLADIHLVAGLKMRANHVAGVDDRCAIG